MPRRPNWDEVALARAAAEHDQVLDRAVLLEHGVSPNQVAARVRSGRWQALGPRVVVLHGGQLTQRQQHWAAVLHSGAGAALHGLTAAAVGGLTGFSSSAVHTVVPHGSHARNLDTGRLRVRVRQSRHLAPDVLHPVARPPRQSLPTAVIDAAAEASHDGRARLLVLSAVQQRLVRPADLRDVLQSYARIPHRLLIAESIDDAEGGVHSLPELAWNRKAECARLPAATRQQRVRRANGTWFLDCDYEEFQVALEINGAQHDDVSQSEGDDHRRNVLGTAGRLVLTASSYAVRRTWAPVVVVAAGLLSRGWEPDRLVRRRLEALAARERLDLRTGDWARPA